jgi:hypothetical protein
MTDHGLSGQPAPEHNQEWVADGRLVVGRVVDLDKAYGRGRLLIKHQRETDETRRRASPPPARLAPKTRAAAIARQRE